jgi:hypothetical protein
MQLLFLIKVDHICRIIDKIPNPHRPSGFHISDILQLNSNIEATTNDESKAGIIQDISKPKSPSLQQNNLYNLNDYHQPFPYYHSYHSQNLPATLPSYDNELLYNPSNVSTQNPYPQNSYYSTDSIALGNSYYHTSHNLFPATLPNRSWYEGTENYGEYFSNSNTFKI